MVQPLTHLVFDWNGTLFSDVDAVLTAFNALFTHFGHPPATLSRFRQEYAFPFQKFLENHGFTADEIDRHADEAKQVFHDHYGPQESRLGLRDGAADLLRQAQQHGIRCLILSNHVRDIIQAHAERLKIAPYLDTILAYADIASQGTSQSKGDMLAATTLIIGDSPEETEIGRRLHMQTAGLTGGYTSEARLAAARPDHLLHALPELLPLLTPRAAA